jgi:hypothetical protein
MPSDIGDCGFKAPPFCPCTLFLLLLLEDVVVHPQTIFNFSFFFITSPFRERCGFGGISADIGTKVGSYYGM